MKQENLVLDEDFFVGFSKSTYNENGNFTGFVEINTLDEPPSALIERMETAAYNMIKAGMIPEKGDKIMFSLIDSKDKIDPKKDNIKYKFLVNVIDVEYTITTHGKVIWINILGKSSAFEDSTREIYDKVYEDLDKKRREGK